MSVFVVRVFDRLREVPGTNQELAMKSAERERQLPFLATDHWSSVPAAGGPAYLGSSHDANSVVLWTYCD
jgi:hypothetical protein